jgi:hypothetical protein
MAPEATLAPIKPDWFTITVMIEIAIMLVAAGGVYAAFHYY